MSQADSESSNSVLQPSPATTGIGVAQEIFRSGVLLSGLATCLVSFLGLFSRFEPLCELASHCTFHCLVASLALLPFAYATGARITAGLLVVSAINSAVWVQPFSLWSSPSAARTELADEFKVLSWNVLVSNHSRDEIERIVKAEDPDVLILIELRHGFVDKIPFLRDRYPFRLEHPSWGGEGIGVFSRVPGTEFELKSFDFDFQPAIIGTIPGARGQSLELVALHALSPLPRYRSKIRDRQIRSMIDWSQTRGAVCVCGDLNITPWAPAFQDMINGGFVDSRMGVGNCISWPRQLGFLGIPIDHALSRNDCQIFERQVLEEAAGSDHRPISFRVRF